MKIELRKIAVGIVNWNSGATIIGALESVLNQSYQPVDIWVADNHSEDGSLEKVQQISRVNIIRNKMNIGFAAAQNQIINSVSAEFYMPLNPDCILNSNYIKEMIAVLSSKSSLGWVSGKLLYADPEKHFGRYAGEDYQGKTNVIYTTGHILYHSRRIVNRGAGEIDIGQYDHNLNIFGANGAAPVYKREMLEDIRMGKEYFDELFFVYGEDEDLDWRARRAGWYCRYVPSAQGYHLGEASGGSDVPFIMLEIYKNRYLMRIKNEYWMNILRDWKAVLMAESKELRTLWVLHPRLTLCLIIKIFRAFPKILHKRCILKQTARISPKDFYQLFQTHG